VFIIAAIANIGTAVLAIAVLKPWRFRVVRQGEQVQAGIQIGAAARA
jgi:hypothetical protein